MYIYEPMYIYDYTSLTSF